MLTSRNREKERLYQEIEELKLRLRGQNHNQSLSASFPGPDRSHSVLSDRTSAILDRSVSRAGGAMSVAGGSTMTENERDDYEHQTGALRDRISDLRLKNSDLQKNLNAAYAELDLRTSELEQLHADLEIANQEVQEMQAERNEALRNREDAEMDFQQLREEAEQELGLLEQRLDETQRQNQGLEEELRLKEEDFEGLQGEMRQLSEVVVRLEDIQEQNAAEVGRLEGHIQELEERVREYEQEITALEAELQKAAEKEERMTVQAESSKNEISFLREEQDADKIKIGELQQAVAKWESLLQEEKQRGVEAQRRLEEERKEREGLGDADRKEWEKRLNRRDEEVGRWKEEVRRYKRALQDKGDEVEKWRNTLDDLEKNLREVLGAEEGTGRRELLKKIALLSENLDSALADLDDARAMISNQTRTLQGRENSLESLALENRKLTDLLDRERSQAKTMRTTLESLQSTISSNSTRSNTSKQQAAEIATLTTNHHRQLQKLQEKLGEMIKTRNLLLIESFTRLATICGKDWAARNSAVSAPQTKPQPGNEKPALKLTMLDAFGDSSNLAFPAASRNYLLAVKTLESIFHGFKARVKNVERDLLGQLGNLQTNLDSKTKRLEKLETHIPTLTSDNARLKTELAAAHSSASSPNPSTKKPSSPLPPQRTRTALEVATDAVSRGGLAITPPLHPPLPHPHLSASHPAQTNPLLINPTEDDRKWILKLRELEKRLKQEREARLLDRTMAKRNIEEARGEREAIRKELERERERVRRELGESPGSRRVSGSGGGIVGGLGAGERVQGGRVVSSGKSPLRRAETVGGRVESGAKEGGEQ